MTLIACGLGTEQSSQLPATIGLGLPPFTMCLHPGNSANSAAGAVLDSFDARNVPLRAEVLATIALPSAAAADAATALVSLCLTTTTGLQNLPRNGSAGFPMVTNFTAQCISGAATAALGAVSKRNISAGRSGPSGVTMVPQFTVQPKLAAPGSSFGIQYQDSFSLPKSADGWSVPKHKFKYATFLARLDHLSLCWHFKIEQVPSLPCYTI